MTTTNKNVTDLSEVNILGLPNKNVIYLDPVLKDYVPQFLKALDEDIIRIIEYLHTKNFEKIRGIAHKLKGEGGTFGFDEAGKIGALMQTAAINENSAEIAHLIKRLDGYLKQIEIIT
ncbi:MAG: Hpt domain-containing protein [Acidobacteria bacterium]|jgi:HPt (histidine-containing phosphotransfer) domain-containing protein|nr:Hpt domain-containing protein [Acidobacteriota bacterium]